MKSFLIVISLFKDTILYHVLLNKNNKREKEITFKITKFTLKL